MLAIWAQDPPNQFSLITQGLEVHSLPILQRNAQMTLYFLQRMVAGDEILYTRWERYVGPT